MKLSGNMSEISIFRNICKKNRFSEKVQVFDPSNKRGRILKKDKISQILDYICVKFYLKTLKINKVIKHHLYRFFSNRRADCRNCYKILWDTGIDKKFS